MNTERILVTGAAGQLGREVVRCLSGLNHHVIAITRTDCNLLDAKSTMDMMMRHQPTLVLHLAAKCGGLFINMDHNVDMMVENTRMALNVFEAAHAAGVQDMIVILSTCVFPPIDNGTFDERDLYQGNVHSSNSGYATAKRFMAQLCQTYNDSYGRNYLWLAPCNLYGPEDRTHHVIADIKDAIQKATRTKEEITLKGTGKAVRQFIHVSDVARFMVQLIHTNHETIQDIKNLGGLIVAPRESHSIAEVCHMLCSHMNYPFYRVRFSGNAKEDGQPYRVAKTSQLTRLFPDFEMQTLKDGLASLLHDAV